MNTRVVRRVVGARVPEERAVEMEVSQADQLFYLALSRAHLRGETIRVIDVGPEGQRWFVARFRGVDYRFEVEKPAPRKDAGAWPFMDDLWNHTTRGTYDF